MGIYLDDVSTRLVFSYSFARRSHKVDEIALEKEFLIAAKIYLMVMITALVLKFVLISNLNKKLVLSLRSYLRLYIYAIQGIDIFYYQ